MDLNAKIITKSSSEQDFSENIVNRAYNFLRQILILIRHLRVVRLDSQYDTHFDQISDLILPLQVGGEEDAVEHFLEEGEVGWWGGLWRVEGVVGGGRMEGL